MTDIGLTYTYIIMTITDKQLRFGSIKFVTRYSLNMGRDDTQEYLPLEMVIAQFVTNNLGGGKPIEHPFSSVQSRFAVVGDFFLQLLPEVGLAQGLEICFSFCVCLLPASWTLRKEP